MGIKYIIKDNFLNQTDFENLKNTIMGEDFPWYFQEQFFWCHMFFGERYVVHNKFFNNLSSFNSPYKILLDPFLNKLKIKALIRLKANLYPNQGKMIEHQNHTDFPFKHKGAVFSLNTCDGFTALKDGTKIQSVANRILLFDASQPHRSSTSSNTKVRCNINVNYF
tara:strand:+ start:94 stop:591 length:498 start_codon:yes stop_codon:yes gene_type:complete